jgi:hypothetical protein
VTEVLKEIIVPDELLSSSFKTSVKRILGKNKPAFLEEQIRAELPQEIEENEMGEKE